MVYQMNNYTMRCSLSFQLLEYLQYTPVLVTLNLEKFIVVAINLWTFLYFLVVFLHLYVMFDISLCFISQCCITKLFFNSNCLLLSLQAFQCWALLLEAECDVGVDFVCEILGCNINASSSIVLSSLLLEINYFFLACKRFGASLQTSLKLNFAISKIGCL